MEIKFSTLWRTGVYKFQQLRNQDYRIVICLGISPFGAHCWAIPKDEIFQRWKSGAEGLCSQHGGAVGTDTAWLSFRIGSVPQWLVPFGGCLQDAVAKLEALAPHGK